MADMTEYEKHFLENVAEQIAYKPLRPAVMKELQDHIEDRTEEYREEGAGDDEAVRRAVDTMGDGVSIGADINAVRCVRTDWPLVIMTAFLLLFGMAAAAYMYWDWYKLYSFYHYFPGAAMLVFTVYKGYPMLVRHHKKMMMLMAAFFSVEAVCLLFIHNNILPSLFWDKLRLPWHMIDYYTLLMTGPAAVVFLYHFRKNTGKSLAAVFLAAGAAILFHVTVFRGGFTVVSASIFLFSMIGTVIFMIRRNIFSGRRRRLWGSAAAGSFVLLLLLISFPGQAAYMRAFLTPETETFDPMQDAYNGVLIQELLSQTPAVGGIALTPEEMMEYGTGEWYFSIGDAKEAAEEGKRLSEPVQLRNVQYDASNVTLWDILPQNYRNNYLLSVAILRFGWIAGIIFLSVFFSFYVMLFSCIRKIHGALAGAVSVNCGLCLLFQSIFYILGNFGFQYGSFTNLPLISEGKMSIFVNLLLLGFILSAYRYDRVIDAPVGKPISKLVL